MACDHPNQWQAALDRCDLLVTQAPQWHCECPVRHVVPRPWLLRPNRCERGQSRFADEEPQEQCDQTQVLT